MRVFFLILICCGAVARADIADELKVCADMADAASRLACFDAIGRVATPEPEDEVEVTDMPLPPTSAPPTPEPPRPVAPLDAAEKNSIDAVTPREREAMMLEAEEAARESEASAKREQRALEKAATDAEKTPETESGMPERDRPVMATITRVVRHADSRFSVTLDNGQVWRETQGSRVGIPDEGASVELMRGRFGGYRMTIDGLYRTAWVKQTN